MQRTRVSSSNIASVGYDPASNTLEVEFHSGSVYQYFRVPSSVHDGLMSAPSKGGYFDAYVKRGGYSYNQIR